MKSLDDLKKIRDKAQSKVTMRGKAKGIRVLVGMATCGISAGARPVTITPVGCIGECAIEPIVEVLQGEDRTTYCKVTEEAVDRIVTEHIQGGKPVQDYVIGKYRL